MQHHGRDLEEEHDPQVQDQHRGHVARDPGIHQRVLELVAPDRGSHHGSRLSQLDEPENRPRGEQVREPFEVSTWRRLARRP